MKNIALLFAVCAHEYTVLFNQCMYSIENAKLKKLITYDTVEPRYNEVLGTMKITLLYQISHYIRVKKQRYIKSWDQLNHLVIRGFCYIRPLYNEVPLYLDLTLPRSEIKVFVLSLGHKYPCERRTNDIFTIT